MKKVFFGMLFGFAGEEPTTVTLHFPIAVARAPATFFRFYHNIIHKFRNWDTISELKCYSESCQKDVEVKFALGKYKLVLIGKEGVFESNVLKVH